jgi:hypothetical protein
MNNAANALVNTGLTANLLVVTGKTQKSFQNGICYETEENLFAAKRELEQSLETQLASGTSRFSDLVQGLRTKLAILNANLGIVS